MDAFASPSDVVELTSEGTNAMERLVSLKSALTDVRARLRGHLSPNEKVSLRNDEDTLRQSIAELSLKAQSCFREAKELKKVHAVSVAEEFMHVAHDVLSGDQFHLILDKARAQLGVRGREV